eukprot:COSAG01_NODE_1640_length_9652_cov_70.145295_10_plen_54_part_00
MRAAVVRNTDHVLLSFVILTMLLALDAPPEPVSEAEKLDAWQVRCAPVACRVT